MDMFSEDIEVDGTVLCAANAYEEKYYLNPDFLGLPSAIKEELQIICVLYTAEIGGILVLHFDDEGNLLFHTTARESDLLYDDIGSVLKIKQIQMEKVELLESLEVYFKAVFLHEDVSDLLDD